MRICNVFCLNCFGVMNDWVNEWINKILKYGQKTAVLPFCSADVYLRPDEVGEGASICIGVVHNRQTVGLPSCRLLLPPLVPSTSPHFHLPCGMQRRHRTYPFKSQKRCRRCRYSSCSRIFAISRPSRSLGHHRIGHTIRYLYYVCVHHQFICSHCSL